MAAEKTCFSCQKAGQCQKVTKKGYDGLKEHLEKSGSKATLESLKKAWERKAASGEDVWAHAGCKMEIYNRALPIKRALESHQQGIVLKFKVMVAFSLTNIQ